jgi:ATP-dependent RNA/DNA helicase IGHMBP2
LPLLRLRHQAKKRELQAEQRRLRREIRGREEKVVADVIKHSDVICTTCVGAASHVLRSVFGPGRKKGTAEAGGPSEPVYFDMVVIDEAAQAIEASCWIPIMMGRRLVLAGDHLQVRTRVTLCA